MGRGISGFQLSLDGGLLALNPVLGRPISPIRIMARREVIQEALGHSAARATLHYTLPDLTTLTGDAEATLERVLPLLQQELHLPFTSSYAARLGNFEVFDLQTRLEGPRPTLIEISRGSREKQRSGPETLEICRTTTFASATHIASLRARAAGDVVVNRLITLAAGQRRVAVDVPEALDGLEFQLFDESGEILLHSEESYFMNRVGLVLAPVGRQTTIEDDFSRRARQGGADLAKRAAVVVSSSPQLSVIGAPEPGSWRAFADGIAHLAAARLPPASEDKWFPRDIESEVNVISHFDSLLDGGRVRGAVLVDPWFGADAVMRLAMRLGSHNVHLTVLTSWTSTDPDTGSPLPDRKTTAALEAALEQVRPYLNPRLTVINLTDGTQQAFHDRYLMLYPHEGPSKVFMLSNSLNKVAGNWPFAMSLLAPDVGRELRRYIEDLPGRRRAPARSARGRFPELWRGERAR